MGALYTKRSLRAIAMIFPFLSALANAAGNDGYIQTPGVGQYCSNFFNALYDNLLMPYDCMECGGCNFCWSGEYQKCPWRCYQGCDATYTDRDYYTGEDSFYTKCSAGCVSTAGCTAISNGYFTGAGTVVGNPSSCPFACNAGYTKTGMSCVAAAAPTTAAKTTTTAAPTTTTAAPTTPAPTTTTAAPTTPAPTTTTAAPTTTTAAPTTAAPTTAAPTTAAPTTAASITIAQITGNNGEVQYPVTGEYCTNYVNAINHQSYFCDVCTALSFCRSGYMAVCPWNYGSNLCQVAAYGFNNDNYQDEYNVLCAAGCVSTSVCTAVSNGRFTGAGTTPGNPNSCPFACNAGYTKSGMSCVPVVVVPITAAPTTAAPTTAAATTTTAAPTTAAATTTTAAPTTAAPTTAAQTTPVPTTTPTPNAAGPNAFFTGAGTIANNATSCPFRCADGYFIDGYACVPSCPLGKYLSSGACVECTPCPNGHYKTGCLGASPGTCEGCTNLQ
jgi:hypothetical protein